MEGAVRSCEEGAAEEALLEALSHVPASAAMDASLLGEATLLAVLDRFPEEGGE